MLVVITSENSIENEANLINTLFKEGLKVLHLRKPSLKSDGWIDLLEQIDARYRNRIVVHNHHDLCRKFNLKGIHLKEQDRIKLGENLKAYTEQFKNDCFSVSTSFHNVTDLEQNKIDYDYCFLSPVFTSISKADYNGKAYNVNHIKRNSIALGGIHAENILEAKALGYQGVAVLGSIWNTGTPIESFKKINEIYKT